jgi:hypothetical protein
MFAQVTLATEGEGTMIAWDFSVDGRRVSENGCCQKGSFSNRAFLRIIFQAAHIIDSHQLRSLCLLTRQGALIVSGGRSVQLDTSIR